MKQKAAKKKSEIPEVIKRSREFWKKIAERAEKLRRLKNAASNGTGN